MRKEAHLATVNPYLIKHLADEATKAQGWPLQRSIAAMHFKLPTHRFRRSQHLSIFQTFLSSILQWFMILYITINESSDSDCFGNNGLYEDMFPIYEL